ncbi:MAG: hypothetical protein O8C64_02865 [Candidatus Methanoperedens sp.]|nr:hypothetical protein [Candidatus Methanoperedens sp.]MCZ7406500.1 hypothetical protein [Candidatus Methanoperedens sp.]
MAEIKIELTGNPFVDTGLSVIVARADKENIKGLTKEDLKKVVGDGVWIAKANRQLKAFNMVIGINSPLTNTSTNPSLKKENKGILIDEDDEGMEQYISILKDLCNDSMPTVSETDILCEACGKRPTSNVLERHNKEIGREWFPLAGSIGNDAQAFPSASRCPRICSLCLLSIQFLPLGAMVLKGKVACFQSTSSELTQHMVCTIYKETDERLQTLKTSDKLSAIGKEEGSKKAVSALIDMMYNLNINKKMLNLPKYAELNIWLFTNSGQNPDCDIIEIPNSALQFLWEATKMHRQEIEDFLRREPKKPERTLLNCIVRKQEYFGFYPYKGSKPSSKELFELYQTRVLDVSSYSLKLAEWMASQIKLALKNNEKLLKKLIKENAIESKELSVQLNKLFADFAENGLFFLEEYIKLFPYNSLHPLKVKKDAYRWIWFYLNHEILSTEKIKDGEDDMFANPKIKSFAKDVLEYYSSRRGLNYIKKNILDAFREGKIYTSDIQRWFTNLGEIKEGYTNEEWDDLCRDENGENNLWEIKFQLRLELANLYRMASLEAKK